METGRCIVCGVVVFNGLLYSQVYGMCACILSQKLDFLCVGILKK